MGRGFGAIVLASPHPKEEEFTQVSHPCENVNYKLSDSLVNSSNTVISTISQQMLVPVSEQVDRLHMFKEWIDERKSKGG